MLTVREVAAEAYAKVVERQERARLADVDRQRLQHEREEQAREKERRWAAHVQALPANPLPRWFPDDPMRIWDHKYNQYVILIPHSEEYDGTLAPKDRIFFIIWAHEEPFDTSTGTHTVIQGVGLTSKRNDPQYGFQWENVWFTRGMGLTGPSDVGRYLREAEARRERSSTPTG